MKKNGLLTWLLSIWINCFLFLNLQVRQKHFLTRRCIFKHFWFILFVLIFLHVQLVFLNQLQQHPNCLNLYLSFDFFFVFIYIFIFFFFIHYFSLFHAIRIWSRVKLNLFRSYEHKLILFELLSLKQTIINLYTSNSYLYHIWFLSSSILFSICLSDFRMI